MAKREKKEKVTRSVRVYELTHTQLKTIGAQTHQTLQDLMKEASALLIEKNYPDLKSLLEVDSVN